MLPVDFAVLIIGDAGLRNHFAGLTGQQVSVAFCRVSTDEAFCSAAFSPVSGANAFYRGANSFCNGAKPFCNASETFCSTAKSFLRLDGTGNVPQNDFGGVQSAFVFLTRHFSVLSKQRRAVLKLFGKGQKAFKTQSFRFFFAPPMAVLPQIHFLTL
jgi:hypothetical protein